ncbi:Disulfide-bond oxidoreductase YfcG [Cytospora mali]|uniref:Disulfide-bond oxidoreductase YfcG n=1 Tax=Cytospora mali TaxID=578113 RepID=A0A194UN92_CYTMA|nr:Disulfide-bond oxidoreductase YfcG [Valsa mali var. pyri (nom. inval.)]
MADKPEPTGPLATDGIELFTTATPNGYKASIVLEELKEAYGDKAPKYTWQAINIMKNTQKQEWFINISPNGRIPAIIDHDRGDFPVFEGLAILSYLTKHYDPENKISFPYESDDHSIAEQWISWQHGGVGPMQGQANHFRFRSSTEKIPYAIQRYVGETERLYGILDARLKDRDYVAGPGKGKFSIADISLLGWVNGAGLIGLDLPGQFPNVAAWFDRCSERPGVQRGFAIPQVSGFGNKALAQKVQEDPEVRKKEEEVKKFIDEAKAQYGYKYASP